MAYSFIDLAFEVFKGAAQPLTSQEIWQTGQGRALRANSERRARRPFLAAALSALVAGVTVTAQSGPSFDCAKTSNTVERAICNNPQFAAADRTMAAADSALVATLTGTAKEHLVKDQRRWITDRDRDCGAKSGELEGCLELRIARCIENLKAFGEGPYPFVGTQSIYKNAELGKNDAIDLQYPQFTGTTANFKVVNGRFSGDAGKIVDQTLALADPGPGWSYQQDFAL